MEVVDLLIPTLFPFLTAALITFFAIPPLITLATEKHLHDEPNYRKKHAHTTPTLGGIAIFAGILISYTFWVDDSDFIFFKYTLISIIILFFIGIKDDIIGLSVIIKVVTQIVAALIIIIFADIRLTNLNGVFGIYEIEYYASFYLTLIMMIGITNSFNLLDGVDGLASGIAFIISGILSIWFFYSGFFAYSILGFALAGALLGFLKYNFSPARIFMGDTGALLLGFLISILIIVFVEINIYKENLIGGHFPINFDIIAASPAIAIAMIIVPLFDTIRVMIIRIINKKSPFSPDRSHIHHLLKDLGMSDVQVCFILYGYTILMIGLSFYLQQLGTLILIGVIILISMLSTIVAIMLLKGSVKRQHLAEK
ncbi:MAG: undecaprenyl/decaprenyl-phosphate alpha-N-acetylglucosaminyl 1-phosphate transferase [Bacteroidetes bacterium]|nr:undecaprenyl/decaprenyl-phosphate alpha-N-acetylglucosaminyl 1-phosphate transferase [Bacteroidota bacterium]